MIRGFKSALEIFATGLVALGVYVTAETFADYGMFGGFFNRNGWTSGLSLLAAATLLPFGVAQAWFNVVRLTLRRSRA